MTEPDAEYVGAAINGPACVVRFTANRVKGRGVIATADILKDQVVWTEAPLAAMQHLQNRTVHPGCGFCLRPLERCDEKLVASCVAGCGVYYCSQGCADAAWRDFHELLCVGHVREEEADSHPLVLFKQHACETNEVLLLAGQCIAQVLCTVNHTGCSVEQAMRTYTRCFGMPWWEVPLFDEQDEMSVAEQELVRTQMAESLHQSLAYLHAYLDRGNPNLVAVFQPEFMSHVLGAFELNNIAISILLDPTAEISTEHVVDEELTEEDDEDWEDEDENSIHHEDAGPPAVQGTALFRYVSILNHSCEPNVAVFYMGGNNHAHVRALRDIAAGEELFISYIDEQENYEERQRQLREYRFRCDCRRCKSRE